MSDAPSATNKARIRNTAFELWLSNSADCNRNKQSLQFKNHLSTSKGTVIIFLIDFGMKQVFKSLKRFQR